MPNSFTDIDDNFDEIDLPNVTDHSDLDVSVNNNGILLFNGKKYAAGLTWLTINNSEETSSVSKRANQIGADFFCNRAFIEQSGFGTLKQGHRMGMSSVAAMAADVLVGEWHGIFVADNGWYYVAVHADNIAPNGDVLFESEEDAYNHFVQMSENYNWPKTYVAEAWNFKGNDGEIPLDRIIEDVATTALRPANLNALFSGKANKNFAAIGVILFILFLVISLFSGSILSKFIPDRAVAKHQISEMSDILVVPPKKINEKPNPLLEAIENFYLIKPSKIVENCIMNFDDLMISLPGWELSKMRCRSNFVEALWQQNSGSLETIKNYLDQFPFGVSSTYGSRGDFLASRILSNLTQHNEKIKLSSRESVLITLNSLFGNLGKLEVRDIIPSSKRNKRISGGSRRLATNKSTKNNNFDKVTVQDLPSLGVKIETKTSPILIKQYFNIPGLKVNTLEWDVRNGTWLYDLQIYLFPQNSKVSANIRKNIR